MTQAARPAVERPVPLSAARVLAIAQLHEQENRLPEAATLLDDILAAYPRDADALHLAAIVAHRRGLKDEALRLMQSAIAHGVNTPLYHRNIAELYRLVGRLEEAESSARQAIALNPGDPVALLNFGLVLTDLGRPEEAIPFLQQALAVNADDPAAHFGLAEAFLVRGEFRRGWEEYQWRFRLPGAGAQLPKTNARVWDGTAMPDETLLLFADQGFGDGIQFGRYIPWAAERCGAASLACSAQLRPILQDIHPNLRVFTDWKEAGRFGAWCTLSGLPRLAGTILSTIPSPIPYLHADTRAMERWRARLDLLVAPGLRRVGLVWAGRPTHKNDFRRSATLQALAPIAALDGVALVVLQKGPSQAEVGVYRGQAPLIHLSTEIADFRDTMAIIAGLDLVITVDTSVAHLAGAMGHPVWLMLPHVAEWRWLQARDDTPWYPSARLFRQTVPGDWRQLATRVAAALGERGKESPCPNTSASTTLAARGERKRMPAMAEM